MKNENVISDLTDVVGRLRLNNPFKFFEKNLKTNRWKNQKACTRLSLGQG